jgi:hypothetical protein
MTKLKVIEYKVLYCRATRCRHAKTRKLSPHWTVCAQYAKEANPFSISKSWDLALVYTSRNARLQDLFPKRGQGGGLWVKRGSRGGVPNFYDNRRLLFLVCDGPSSSNLSSFILWSDQYLSTECWYCVGFRCIYVVGRSTWYLRRTLTSFWRTEWLPGWMGFTIFRIIPFFAHDFEKENAVDTRRCIYVVLTLSSDFGLTLLYES